MDVIPARLHLVVMLFALQVHQNQFIDQPKLFQEFDGSIQRCTVNIRLLPSGQLQERSGIQMLFGALNDFDKDAALRGKAHALGCKFIQERAALEWAHLAIRSSYDRIANYAKGTRLCCDTVAMRAPLQHYQVVLYLDQISGWSDRCQVFSANELQVVLNGELSGRRVSTALRQPAWEFSEFLSLSLPESAG